MKNVTREAVDFGDKILKLKGISEKAVTEHLKLYKGYIAKYNAIQESLSKLTDEDYTGANQTYSLIRELKVEQTFAWGGIINHEIYFAHLGGSGGAPAGDIGAQITKDFGSYDAYKRDMKATAIAARGWVWTAWNHGEGRLVNYLGDAQNSYPVWGATPIVALDTYEHAYFMDFGADRGSYIDVFFDNMNWDVVERSMGHCLMCCCADKIEENGGCCGGECGCAK